MPPPNETNPPTEPRTKQGFADLLTELADLYGVEGMRTRLIDPRYLLMKERQAKAWRVASQKIASHDAPAQLTEDSPRLFERVKGVGETTIELMKQYITTGTFEELEDIKADPWVSHGVGVGVGTPRNVGTPDPPGRHLRRAEERGVAPAELTEDTLRPYESVLVHARNKKPRFIRTEHLERPGNLSDANYSDEFKQEIRVWFETLRVRDWKNPLRIPYELKERGLQHGIGFSTSVFLCRGERLKLDDVDVLWSDLEAGRWDGFDAYKNDQEGFLKKLSNHKPAIDEYYDAIVFEGRIFIPDTRKPRPYTSASSIDWDARHFIRDYGAEDGVGIRSSQLKFRGDPDTDRYWCKFRGKCDYIRENIIYPIIRHLGFKATDADDERDAKRTDVETNKRAKPRELEESSKKPRRNK